MAKKQGEGFHVACTNKKARRDYDIDETLEAVHIALSGANLTASDIDEILLVGGSTRTPVVGDNVGFGLPFLDGKSFRRFKARGSFGIPYRYRPAGAESVFEHPFKLFGRSRG